MQNGLTFYMHLMAAQMVTTYYHQHLMLYRTLLKVIPIEN